VEEGKKEIYRSITLARMMKCINIEPVLWNLGPGASTLREQIPQLLWVIGVAGKVAAHANYGDGDWWRHHAFLWEIIMVSCRVE
jgi:hypothetical protein